MGCKACSHWASGIPCSNEGCNCACHAYDRAPAQPGDILVYTDDSGQETRQVVAEASVCVVPRGGRDGDPDNMCVVTIRTFAEESELVIAKGGGCYRVLPLEDFSSLWGWPPEDHKLLRDGGVLWEPPSVEPPEDI